MSNALARVLSSERALPSFLTISEWLLHPEQQLPSLYQTHHGASYTFCITALTLWLLLSAVSMILVVGCKAAVHLVPSEGILLKTHHRCRGAEQRDAPPHVQFQSEYPVW